MKTVNHLWLHHHNRTGEGLRSFIRALFELEWVADNVPRNPNTERMMALLVSVLITAMMDCITKIHILVHKYFRSVTFFFLEAKMLVGR